jgi:Xaa-Pro dipeptidase
MTSMLIPATEPFVDVERAQKLMDAEEVEALVASSLRNVFYLSGQVAIDCLVEADASVFAVLPASPSAAAHVTIPVAGAYMLENFPAWPPEKVFFGRFYIKGGPSVANVAVDSVDALARSLQAVGAERSRVGFELDLLPVDLLRRIVAALPGLQVVDASSLFRRLRMRKSAPEVERITTATLALEAAIAETIEQVRVGVTEIELDRYLRQALIRRGVEPATVSLGAAGHGALVWSYATDRAVAAGDVIRFDITASYGFYHSDLARTCVVGEPTSEQSAYFRAVFEAVETAIATIRPGGSTADVFAAAIEVPRAMGFADFERHNFGHGVGLQVHEAPFIAAEGEEIPPGAVLAVEAPYYVYDLGGFASEDVVVVGEHGVERLTHAPAELPVVG